MRSVYSAGEHESEPVVTELTLDTAFERGAPNLEGEACNADGTLKDATEIQWVHSPSDLTPPPPEKRCLDDTEDEGPEELTSKRRCVSNFQVLALWARRTLTYL